MVPKRDKKIYAKTWPVAHGTVFYYENYIMKNCFNDKALISM